jgi:hypothetical protein
MKKELKPTLQLALIIAGVRTDCYWCARTLRQCGMCSGSGRFRNEKCKPCKGQGCLCPTHEGDWDE